MDKSQSKAPCFLCGGTSFEWRWIQGDNYAIKLRPLDESAFNLFPSKEKLKARLCNNCGNILLFASDYVDEN